MSYVCSLKSDNKFAYAASSVAAALLRVEASELDRVDLKLCFDIDIAIQDALSTLIFSRI